MNGIGTVRSCFRPGILAAFVLLAACRPAHVERKWTVMGTYASAEIYADGTDLAGKAVEEVRSAFDRVDASMSNWKPESELSRMNRVADREEYSFWDADLRRCVEGAFDVARRTGGRFDPTVGPLMQLWGFRPHAPRVPSSGEVRAVLDRIGFQKVRLDAKRGAIRFLHPEMEIDLGGIAKGYALDVALRGEALRSSQAALLDLGGNLYAKSRPPGAEGWTVGIRDPGNPSGTIATLSIRDRAVATSGDYENSFESGGRRYGHHMDPATGFPSESDVVSVTTIAGTGMLSDALGTAFLVGGSGRAPDVLSAFAGTEVVLLVRRADGLELLASRSLTGRLSVDPAFAPRVGGAIRFTLPPSR